jgi:hypothetical protein
MSALLPRADIHHGDGYVSFVLRSGLVDCSERRGVSAHRIVAAMYCRCEL